MNGDLTVERTFVDQDADKTNVEHAFAILVRVPKTPSIQIGQLLGAVRERCKMNLQVIDARRGQFTIKIDKLDDAVIAATECVSQAKKQLQRDCRVAVMDATNWTLNKQPRNIKEQSQQYFSYGTAEVNIRIASNLNNLLSPNSLLRLGKQTNTQLGYKSESEETVIYAHEPSQVFPTRSVGLDVVTRDLEISLRTLEQAKSASEECKLKGDSKDHLRPAYNATVEFCLASRVAWCFFYDEWLIRIQSDRSLRLYGARLLRSFNRAIDLIDHIIDYSKEVLSEPDIAKRKSVTHFLASIRLRRTLIQTLLNEGNTALEEILENRSNTLKH